MDTATAPLIQQFPCTLADGCTFTGDWPSYLEHAPAHELPHPDRRAAWLHSRSTFLGASEVSAVVGASPYAGPIEVWAAKIEPMKELPFRPIPIAGGGHVVVPPTATGTMLERHLLDDFAKRHGCSYHQPATRRHADHPWFAATPDADVAAGPLVQVKVVGVYTAHDWDAGPPFYTLMQVQAEMEVWGRDRCVVLALIGSEVREYLVEREPETIQPAIQICADFWGYVERRQLPVDFDLRSTRAETLWRMWPRAKILGLERADEELIRVAHAYASARELEKAGKDDKEPLGVQLKAMLGERAGVWWGGSERKPLGKVTWTNNQDAIDKGALLDELLARLPGEERAALEAKHTTAGARVLRVTLKGG